MIYNLFGACLPVASLTSLVYSYQMSDPVGQLIVIGLGVASVFITSIMVTKYLEFRRVEKLDREFLRAFERQMNPLEIHVHGPAHTKSPMAQVYKAGCDAVRREFQAQAQKQNRPMLHIDLSSERLSALQIDAIRKAAECAAADQILLLESQMSWVASGYTVAPMLGLFGTVWGVMIAFEAMGQQGGADITAVAPGIASAMLTTVIGMVIAIVAALGNNKLAEKIRFNGIQMENFSEKFTTRLQQSFVHE